MYWNEYYECMDREELEALQLERLKQTVERVYYHVAPYRALMDEAGVKPSDIQSLADLSKLPFMKKQFLRDNYPFGLFAVPMSEVNRIHSSSGTSGKPTVVGYTKKDLDNWAELVARDLTMVGVRPNDIVHVSYGYGLFTGGMGLHDGASKLGATVVPASGGNTKRQVMILADYGATVLACTPSYAMYLAESLEKEGLRDQIKLKFGVFGAEPWSENMRQELQKKLGIKAYDIYGMSEQMGPGVAMECTEQNGLHVHEDHFIVETIDPETGEVLPPGERGELVFTSLTKEAFPIVRYRTRDIARLIMEPCPCGRTSRRIGRIEGRSDDMLIIRGVNVFPSQIEHVLLSVAGIEPQYQLVVDRIGALDTLEVQVEVSKDFPFDEVKQLENLSRQIRKELESSLGISVTVKLVEPESIVRSEGKAKRIIDKREK